MDLDRVTALLQATPPIVVALFDGLGDDLARRRPTPAEWSPIEVLGHLVTCDDLAFDDRIMRLVAEDGATLPAFDPDTAAGERADRDRDVADVVAEFTRNRARCVERLGSLDRDQLDGMAAGPASLRGITAWDFVVEWPYHDQEHLAQIGRAVGDALFDALGPSMQTALRPDHA